MPESLGPIILFFVGIIAGVINVTSGGGSSLTLPALIFLGMDPTMANGTNRLAILFQNASASLSFWNERYYPSNQSFLLGLSTVPGAILGAVFAVKISDLWFQRILAIVLIGVVISVLIPNKKSEYDLFDPKKISWLVYPSLFVVGFYGGFIQVGTGLLLIAVLFHLLKIDLVTTNMHKAYVMFIYTIPALLIFTISGNMDWLMGVILAFGMALGGWWAARMTVRKGEKFVKYFLVLALIVIIIKLIGII